MELTHSSAGPHSLQQPQQGPQPANPFINIHPCERLSLGTAVRRARLPVDTVEGQGQIGHILVPLALWTTIMYLSFTTSCMYTGNCPSTDDPKNNYQ